MIAALSQHPLRDARNVDSAGAAALAVACFHCGTPCPDRNHVRGERSFCCLGCQTVHELLQDQGLGHYYDLGATPGRRQPVLTGEDRYAFLDDPSVRDRLLDFASDETQRVTFHVPAIHCVACVWLLENLFRLQPGVGSSTVNFARREVSIQFDPRQVSLAKVAGVLDSLGYPPDLKLSALDSRRGSAVPRRLWLQLGVAGFVFGNTMLFSLPGYFGLDAFSGPAFQKMFGVLSLLLGLPVVLFSAADYWRAAWYSLQQRRLSIEVPIALGIAALFAQSAYEVLSGYGEGYFDSLAGLLFFLLSGRVFQQKAFDRLTFDRDYKAFFPLSVIRLNRAEASAGTEERVSLAQLNVGDQLRIRHGELVPADSRLIRGEASMDYSFVTGEADPVQRRVNEVLYAGGCQTGGTIDLEILKPVSQSYLASLWNQEAFRKEKDDTFDTLTNRYSVRFTWLILLIAAGAAAFWTWSDPARGVRAFVGVLIVACPCALALAAPFTLGTAVRVLGRRGFFLRNGQVLEALARIDSVVFDKTGTLTVTTGGEVKFTGPQLSPEDLRAIRALASQSSHPLARRVVVSLTLDSGDAPEVEEFCESLGQGVTGRIQGREWWLGSPEWLREAGVELTATVFEGSSVHVARDGRYCGRFSVANSLRPETDQLLKGLANDCELSLLSGDNDREAARFRTLFGLPATLEFNQSPARKLEFIRSLQDQGRSVMMVGDGLNDAGALRQSQVGVAVVEQIGAFSPASDIILEAGRLPRLGALRTFAGTTMTLIRASFVISTLYNVIGLSIAASGNLSPVVCAILMPLSSVTVVAFAVGAVHWFGRRAGLGPVLGAGEQLS